MNLKSILLVVCVGLFFNSPAQTFSKLYIDDRPSMLFGSVKYFGGNFYLTGVTTQVSNPQIERAVITKINPDGTQAFLKPIPDSSNYSYSIFANTLKKTNDGNFIATGDVTDSVYKAFIVKLDTNGNILLWHEYTTPNNLIFQGGDIIEIPGSGYLVAINMEVNYVSNVRMIRTDTAGNIINQRDYYKGQIAFPNVIKPMYNGHYMVGAWSGPLSGNSPYYAQTWLLEVDSMGNMVRDWLDPDMKNIYPNGMEQTADSGWIIARQHIAYDSLDFQADNGSLLKLDKNFNKQWEIDTGGSAQDAGLFDVKILSNGDYICVGANPINLNQDSSHIYGWIMNVSANGKILWDRTYLADSVFMAFNYLNSLDILPDGGIVACGRVEASDIGQQGWVIFTDSTGCLQGYCGRATNVQEEINEQQQLPFKIYPNPASNYIHIETDIISPNLTLHITDNLGRVILQQAINTTNTQIPLNHLAAGIYFISISDGNGVLEVKKLVVVH